jgi:hypothetical protein
MALNNPAALAMGFVLGLAMLFAVLVGSCAAGGAIAARSSTR